MLKGGLPIANSARRHGIADDDIRHAISFAIEVIDMDDLVMLVGPSRDGTILEVGVSTLEPPSVVHADIARPKFLR